MDDELTTLLVIAAAILALVVIVALIFRRRWKQTASTAARADADGKHSTQARAKEYAAYDDSISQFQQRTTAEAPDMTRSSSSPDNAFEARFYSVLNVIPEAASSAALNGAGYILAPQSAAVPTPPSALSSMPSFSTIEIGPSSVNMADQQPLPMTAQPNHSQSSAVAGAGKSGNREVSLTRKTATQLLQERLSEFEAAQAVRRDTYEQSRNELAERSRQLRQQMKQKFAQLESPQPPTSPAPAGGDAVMSLDRGISNYSLHTS